VIDAARATERVPELLGLGPHLLVTARRPNQIASSARAMVSRTTLRQLGLVVDDQEMSQPVVSVRHFRTWRFDRAEIEDFRLGRDAIGLPFGQVIHVLLRNGEVVTADASWASWGFLFGGRAKREEVIRRLSEWLEPPS
jgi:hypothetical protein